MEKYRVKEIIGTQKFIVQKRFIIREKIIEPNIFDKLLFFIFSIENEDEYKWINLTENGSFNGMYHTKYFNSLKEAADIAEKIKLTGEVKYYELD